MMNDLQDLLKIIQDKDIHLITPRGSMSEADGGMYNAILNQTAPREAPTGGEDMANIEKEYLGSAGADKYFYLAKKVDAGGGLQDILILDAEDKELASATSLNVDPQNIKEFVKYVVKKLDITMLSFDIVEKYFFTPEQKGEVEHEAPDKDRKGPDQTGAEHSDKATGKDMAGVPGGPAEESPNRTGEVAKESKVSESFLGEAWKDHPDPSGFMKAAHTLENALLIWWYNPGTGAFIKTKEATAKHSDDLGQGNIPAGTLADWVRGRVFTYDNVNYLIVYWPEKKHLTTTALQDLMDKVSNSVDVSITRVIDDRGDDISELFEGFKLERAPTGKWSIKESFAQNVDGKKLLDWGATQAHAKTMTDDELKGAMKDCLDCVKQGVDAGYYSDELSVYRAELKKRGGTFMEGKITEARFEVGEIVYYKGKKWEIADHLKGTYALWSPGDHKEELEGWVPEDQLAKVSESRINEDYTKEILAYPAEEIVGAINKLGVEDLCGVSSISSKEVADFLTMMEEFELFEILRQLKMGVKESKINEITLDKWFTELQARFDNRELTYQKVHKAMIQLQLKDEETGEIHLHNLEYKAKDGVDLKVQEGKKDALKVGDAVANGQGASGKVVSIKGDDVTVEVTDEWGEKTSHQVTQPRTDWQKFNEAKVKEGRGEEMYDRALERAKDLISDDMNKYHTYHEDNIRDRIIIEFGIERHEAEDIIYDAVKQMDIGDTPAFEARINEGGSGNKVGDFKADDYGLMSIFGMKDIVLVRVLPWPSDEDTISGEDIWAKTKMGRAEQDPDPDAPVKIHFGLPPTHKSRSLYVEAVDKFGFGDSFADNYYGPETRHFVNPDNVYKNVSQMEQAHKYLYPEVLKDLSTKLRTSPFGKKLGEFGLAEDVKTASADGVTYEPTGQPADVKHAQKVGDKSKMHHKMHDPHTVTEDIDAEVTQAGPAFKDYILKTHKVPWHVLSDETLRQALEDYKKEGATTERRVLEASPAPDLQVPKSKAQKIFKKLIDQEIADIERDTGEDDALGMDWYAFHEGEDNKVYADALLYDVLLGQAEYGFGKEFMVKLNNALQQAGLYLEYDGMGIWTFANEGRQDVADPFVAYKTQGAEKHPVFDDKKGTRHGDNEMVEGENDLKGQAGSGTVAGTPSKIYYTVTPIPGSDNWEVMKHWFDQDGRKSDVLKADLKSKEEAIRYAINAGAKEDDVMVNEDTKKG